MTPEEIQEIDRHIESLEEEIVKAAVTWNHSVKGAALWKDKVSRLRVKQDERRLKRACETHGEALLAAISRLGQSQEDETE